MVFGLARPGIEPDSTVSVADALSTRLLVAGLLAHDKLPAHIMRGAATAIFIIVYFGFRTQARTWTNTP